MYPKENQIDSNTTAYVCIELVLISKSLAN